MGSQKLISVVVPVYCEEAVIEQTYEELTRVMRALPAYRYELIFIDDGSADGTGAILRRLAAADPRAKIVCFSRNFGHQAAITAGIRRARGDAVVTIDADLQDPPSLIPRMLALWEVGNQVVFARREEREGETSFKRATAALFYRLLDRLAGIHIPRNTGDFRLIDRRVADELNRMGEHNRFLRGLVSWVGFRQVAIEYVRNPRRAGETKYPLRKMIRFAWEHRLVLGQAAAGRAQPGLPRDRGVVRRARLRPLPALDGPHGARLDLDHGDDPVPRGCPALHARRDRRVPEPDARRDQGAAAVRGGRGDQPRARPVARAGPLARDSPRASPKSAAGRRGRRRSAYEASERSGRSRSLAERRRIEAKTAPPPPRTAVWGPARYATPRR